MRLTAKKLARIGRDGCQEFTISRHQPHFDGHGFLGGIGMVSNDPPVTVDLNLVIRLEVQRGAFFDHSQTF